MCVSFDYTEFAVGWKVGVCNRCVIEVFVRVFFFCCHVAFWIFLWVKGNLSYDLARSLPFSLNIS